MYDGFKWKFPLGWVWVRNSLDLRSKHTLGMLVSAALVFLTWVTAD